MTESRHELEKPEKDLGNGLVLYSINKHHDLCSVRKTGVIISSWHPSRVQPRSEWINELRG